MPFFSDYGYYHGSVPFSSQYYSQLLPFPGSNVGRSAVVSRVQPRNYNSIAVEQTLRAIRRGPGTAVAARHYSRPVHINASEIDVTSPRRPQQRQRQRTVAGTVDADDNYTGGGGSIHRGRTVVRLHTKNKRTGNSADDESNTAMAVTAVVAQPSSAVAAAGVPACMPVVAEEGLAKKGTIKRHTSAGVKVPVNDDRRPSVTDEILREQEALFDTMIMEEMEVRKDRRKSYPAVGTIADDEKKQQQRKARESRKKSAAAAAVLAFRDPEKSTKKATNWKLNYDVIIEESGIEPSVSYTFKLNKTKLQKSDDGITDVSGDNGKQLDRNALILDSHDDNNNNKHAKNVVKNQIDNSDDVLIKKKTTTTTKKRVIVKKKVVKKTESGKQQQQQEDKEQKKQTPSPPESKKKGSKTEAAAAAATATATVAVITPFVRASFGKTFISPLQVSSTKSKFEKPKVKIKQKSPSPPPQPPSPPPPPPPPSPPAQDSSSEDESSSDDDEDASSLCSSDSSGGSSSSTYYYDSDEYGDKRIACSISSFDSGLPSSPVPASDPIGRQCYFTNNIVCRIYCKVGRRGFFLFRGHDFLNYFGAYCVL